MPCACPPDGRTRACPVCVIRPDTDTDTDPDTAPDTDPATDPGKTGPKDL